MLKIRPLTVQFLRALHACRGSRRWRCVSSGQRQAPRIRVMGVNFRIVLAMPLSSVMPVPIRLVAAIASRRANLLAPRPRNYLCLVYRGQAVYSARRVRCRLKI